MTSIVALFLLSLVLALVMTPVVTRAANRYRMMDRPLARKIHRRAIPGVGGIAIYWAFFLPFVLFLFHDAEIVALIVADNRIVALVVGASLVFGLGLRDDLEPLSPTLKFAVQALAAGIAYWGGIGISAVYLPGIGGFVLGWFALPVTVFWFLLVINAVNLIDGLDGLAAGVSFFSAMILLVLCVISQRTLVAMGLAAMAGSCLGFLRYNFNPASVFMGDSGSYFLGYLLAGLSIMGSIKSQATVAILIPVIALGLPLMDAVWAPIRRFIYGRGMFQPDRDHLHHRLMKLGFSQRRIVLGLYGVTIGLGGLALLLVNARDEQAGLILAVVGAAVILGIRRLGYLEYLTVDKFGGWIRDLSDDMGVSRDRRTFLSWQVALAAASGIDQLWEQMVATAQFLGLDYIELKLDSACNGNGPARRVCLLGAARDRIDPSALDSERVLRLSIPLDDGSRPFGCLVLAKDTRGAALSPYTFSRIEHLRRTVTECVIKLTGNGLGTVPAADGRPQLILPASSAKLSPSK